MGGSAGAGAPLPPRPSPPYDLLMLIAACQLDIQWEDPEANFERAERLIARAEASGARLIVLPEMFSTGFSMDSEAAVQASKATVAYLADAASRHHVFLAGGFIEPATPKPLNTIAFFAPTGDELGRFHKLHPFSLAGEQEVYGAGSELLTLQLEGLRVTPLICYDLRFVEPFRIAADHTDLFVVIANWPRPRRHAWSTLLAARAAECQSFVLGVNRVGEADGQVYTGDSALFDPLGAARATVADTEEVLVARASAAEVSRVRQRFGFLADRRPKLYARLRSETREA